MESGSKYLIQQRQQTLLAYGSTLAACSLLLGSCAIAAAVYATLRFYIGIPFEDQWATIEELGDNHGRYTLSLLWRLHNEHRMPLAKILETADLYWFRGHNISLYLEIYLLQSLHLFAFVWAMRREALWPGWLVAVGSGLAAFSLFWISQHQSFNPLGVGILPAFEFAVFSVIALTAALENPERPSFGWFAASLAAAFLSEASLANGLLVWPLLLVFALRFHLRIRLIIVLALVAALSIGLYLAGFQSPSDHASPRESLSKPFLVGQYLLVYFGNVWASVNVGMGKGLALAGLIAAPVCYLWELLRRKARLFSVAMLSLCMFLIGTGLLTALGRINFGLVQATASRYQSSALLFWLCFALYALDCAVHGGLRTALIASTAILLMAAGILPSLAPSLEGAAEVSERVNGGALALFSDVKDDAELCCKLYAPPDLAFKERPFLRWLQTAFYDDRRYRLLGKQLTANFRIASPNRCFGAFDRSRRVADPKFPGWEMLGWVWDHQRLRPVEAIVAVTDEGTISGAGVSGLSRPDVGTVHHEVSNPAVGWRAYVQGAADFPAVKVYGIVDKGEAVCLATPAFAVKTKEAIR